MRWVKVVKKKKVSREYKFLPLVRRLLDLVDTYCWVSLRRPEDSSIPKVPDDPPAGYKSYESVY